MKGMRRPKAKVLPESATVPAPNLLQPAPNQFSHVVVSEQPFYYDEPMTSPAGVFEPGRKVLVAVLGPGEICRVIDERGLYVATSTTGLRPLSFESEQSTKLRGGGEKR